MKKYIVFAFDNFYPNGGANDLKYLSDDCEDAKTTAIEYCFEYDVVQVFDTEKMEVIWKQELH